MKLGLFYQSGYRIEACYHALNQFRKFYPDAPIAFYEDNSDILKPVAKKFNCNYSKTKIQGRNDPQSGRPAFGVETMKGWLDRVYESCLTTLSEVDWVMNFEDDVWFKRKINGEPPYNLSGIGGRGWNEKLYNYLETNVRGSYGCGGSIFNREKFIEAYNNVKDIDWLFIDEMAEDPKPSEWTDSALTFIFMYSKFSVGGWRELSQYRYTKNNFRGDRRGWSESMEELEQEQGDVAVIHCWKPFYFPTKEEILNVQNILKKYA
jgi:hypothetical protein